MKTDLFVLICLIASSCTAGCWKMGEFLDNQAQDSEAIEDESSASEPNQSYEVDTGIDEAEVLKENPVFEPSISPITYHYALPKYDIASDGFVMEDDNSRWNDLPLTRITDHIFKLYKGHTRPVIVIETCERLNVKTNLFGDVKNRVTCTTGFTLIADDGTQDRYGYLEGKLYKSELGKEPKEYSPTIVAEIPMAKESDIPIAAPKKYIHYTLYIPENPKEYSDFSILQAVNELYESALFPNTRPSQRDHYYILFDGCTSFNGKESYEFTLGSGFDIKSMYRSVRMGVTVDHKYYTYELKPNFTGKTIPLNLAPPKPSGYNNDSDLYSLYVNKYYKNDNYALKIPTPRYRTQKGLTAESAALGFVRLHDNSILNNTVLIPPQKLQTYEVTPKYSVTIYKDYNFDNPKSLYLKWVGVDTIQGEEALEFKENGRHFAITSSGKVYIYQATPVLKGELKENTSAPKLLEDYREESWDDTVEQMKHASLMENVGRFVSWHMKMKHGVKPLKFLTPKASERYIDALIDEYKSESDSMLWRKILYANGEIEGESTYEFEVGQEVVTRSSVILRFKAAISESGKIYIYEDDQPKLVRQITFK